MPRVLLDRYELGEVIGAGGMARVHRARDLTLDRPVAVKVLDDVAARSADPAARDRFLNEARSAAAFGHDHAVAIYDAGEHDGVLFLVMELIDGTTLAAELAERGVLPPDEAVSIVGQILDGLAAMHRASIVHRDIKPANILLDRHGRVKLTDFGIAKRLDDIDDALTSAGVIVGTPKYLAPEQAVGGSLGPPTDVYLVGAVFHEMLTGERPPSVLNGTVQQSVDPRRLRPDVPAALALATTRALAHRPGDRFQTATEMRKALDASTTDRGTGDADRPAPVTVEVPSPVSPPMPPTGHDDDSTALDITALMPEQQSSGAATQLLDAPGYDVQNVDLRSISPQLSAASVDRTVTTARTATLASSPNSRPRPWATIGAVVAAVLLVVGSVFTLGGGRRDGDQAAAAGGTKGPGEASPDRSSADEFLARLREDPEQFGAKGPKLRSKLEDVLQEQNPERRAEKIESLRLDVFGWAAEGKIDVTVGEQLEALLAG